MYSLSTRNHGPNVRLLTNTMYCLDEGKPRRLAKSRCVCIRRLFGQSAQFEANMKQSFCLFLAAQCALSPDVFVYCDCREDGGEWTESCASDRKGAETAVCVVRIQLNCVWIQISQSEGNLKHFGI